MIRNFSYPLLTKFGALKAMAARSPRIASLAAIVALLAGGPTSALAQPAVSSGGVVNAASFTTQVAAGGAASIFGTNLATTTASSGQPQTNLGYFCLEIAT
jgi:hypothetical protein